MTTHRPVCFPDPVPDRANLYDRESALSAVLDSLQHRITVVRGGRMMGKTSLLNVVTQWMEEHGEFAMIRLAPTDSRAVFMAEVLDGIHQWIDEHDRRSPSKPVPRQPIDTVTQFCRRITTLAKKVTGIVFLLCIDEFDSLIEGLDQREARLILELIEHLSAMPRLPVRFLLTMSTIPDLIVRSFRSPIINQSKIVTLEAWDANEAARFVEWLVDDRFILDEAALAEIISAAGGHPYFTKAVVNELLSEPYTPGARYVTQARVASAVRQVVRSPAVDLVLTNLVRAHLTADSVAVLDRAGNSPAGVTARSLSDLTSVGQILGVLQTDGLLRQQGDRYQLRLGMWRGWRAATREVSAPPRVLRRIGRAARRVRLRRAAPYLLLSAVAAPLLLATAYLVPDRTVVAGPCGTSQARVMAYATYPAFASDGDQQLIHVTVVNTGRTTVSGSALVSFSAGQARLDGANGLQYDELRPGEEATQDVPFTTTVPTGWLGPSAAQVGVSLTVRAGGARRARHWSLGIAPVPRLEAIQKIASAVLIVFLIPLLVHIIGSRLFREGRDLKVATDAAKGS